MKTILFILLSFSLHAQAQDLTPVEFSKLFVAEVNQQIKKSNVELAADYKARGVEYPRYYCAKLNKTQIALIVRAASVPDVTVSEFREQILEEIKCFEERWPGLSKTNIWDTILNSGALVKDSYLLHDSLNALSPSGYARDNDLLLRFSQR